MIPALLTRTPDARPAYEVHVCAACNTTLRFERVDEGTTVLLPGETASGPIDDDAWVWNALRAGACECNLPARRWRFAPAIPTSPRITTDEVEARRRDWLGRSQPVLADWAAPSHTPWVAHNAENPLHALAMCLVGIAGDASLAQFRSFCEGGVLDLLEWARAGVLGARSAASWIEAGAFDAHDAACRSRAGQTPAEMDLARSGCAALADQWPGTRPATTECARRLGVSAGPAIARLTVALPTGDRIEIYESTRHEEPVLAAVTVDCAGNERPTPRVIVPITRQHLRSAA